MLAVVIVAPLLAAYAVPFVLLGLAIRELIEQRLLAGAVLAACAGLAYAGLKFAARRFVSWAETRRQAAQH